MGERIGGAVCSCHHPDPHSIETLGCSASGCLCIYPIEERADRSSLSRMPYAVRRRLEGRRRARLARA